MMNIFMCVRKGGGLKAGSVSPWAVCVTGYFLMAASVVVVRAETGDVWNLPAAGTTAPNSNPWVGTTYGSTAGNPYAAPGSVSNEKANFYAVYQSTGGANFDDPYSLMYYSYQFNYPGFSIWSGDPAGTSAFDPHPTFGRDLILGATGSNGFPNSIAPAAGLFFQAPNNGTYSVDIGGTVNISAASAGYANVEIFTLDGSFLNGVFTATSSTPLAQFTIDPTNVAGNGATGNTFSFTDSLNLSQSEVLGVRLYDIAPGTAASGPATIDFSTAGGGVFSITETAEVVPEPSTYALLLAGLLSLGVIARRKKSCPM